MDEVISVTDIVATYDDRLIVYYTTESDGMLENKQIELDAHHRSVVLEWLDVNGGYDD